MVVVEVKIQFEFQTEDAATMAGKGSKAATSSEAPNFNSAIPRSSDNLRRVKLDAIYTELMSVFPLIVIWSYDLPVGMSEQPSYARLPSGCILLVLRVTNNMSVATPSSIEFSAALIQIIPIDLQRRYRVR